MWKQLTIQYDVPQRLGVKKLDVAGYAAHQGCNQLLALGCFSADGGQFQEKTMLSFLLRPTFCVLMSLQLFATWALCVAGIIFIGKEIDDKLANEVIGVLPSPQFAQLVHWVGQPWVLGTAWGILRLYLDSEAGMSHDVTATASTATVLWHEFARTATSPSTCTSIVPVDPSFRVCPSTTPCRSNLSWAEWLGMFWAASFRCASCASCSIVVTSPLRHIKSPVITINVGLETWFLQEFGKISWQDFKWLHHNLWGWLPCWSTGTHYKIHQNPTAPAVEEQTTLRAPHRSGGIDGILPPGRRGKGQAHLAGMAWLNKHWQKKWIHHGQYMTI